MRAAAIFGLGSSTQDLKPFQENADVRWAMGLPSAGEADAILISGGDGTIHRHLPQLVELGVPVLVVPRGSGNDFARALQLRTVKDSMAAWRDFCAAQQNVKKIDLGVITPGGSGAQGLMHTRRYFSCVAGCGLDGEVASRANRLPRWLRAHGGYALSVPGALRGFTAVNTKLKSMENQQSGWVARSHKPLTLIAVANAPTYGGGMKIAKLAQLNDGKLDVCVVGAVSKTRLLGLFPTVYFGRHLSIPEVEYFQAARVSIETERSLALYADGEYVCETPAEIGIVPEALRVIVPDAVPPILAGSR